MSIRFDGNIANYLSRVASVPNYNGLYTAMGWLKWKVDNAATQAAFSLSPVSASNSFDFFGITSGDAFVISSRLNDDNIQSTGGSTATIDKWIHWAIVRNGVSDIRIYIDLVEDAQATIDITGRTAADICSIGRLSVSGDGFVPLDAEMAFCRIWTTNLTLNELTAERLSRRAVKTANLFGDYPMLISASAGEDVSGNAGHFTVNGTIATGASEPPLIAGPPLFRGRLFTFFDDEEVNRSEFWPAIAQGGQTFTQNLSGSLSPSALLLENVGKPVTGSLSLSSSLIRAVSVLPVGIIGPIGSVARQDHKLLEGSETPLGALIKKANQTLAASLSTGGMVAKRTDKPLIGNATPFGLVIKQATLTFSGLVSPSAVFTSIKIVLLALMGVVSPSGSLRRTIGTVLAGTVTSVSSLSNQLQRVFDGVVSPSATVTAIKIVLLTLVGGVSPSAALTARIERMLMGQASNEGSISRQPQRVFAGSVSPSAVIANIKILLLTLMGLLSPSGSMAKSAQSVLSGTITTTGQIVRHTVKIFDGSVTPASVVSSIKIVLLALVGAVLSTGSLAKHVGYQASGELLPVGFISRQIEKLFSGIISLSGTAAKQVHRILTAVLSVVGSAANTLTALVQIIKHPTRVELTSSGKSGVSVNTGTTSVTVNSGETDVSVDS